MMIFGIYYPGQEGCRTNRITLRLTDKEQQLLKDASWKAKLSQAAFIRSRVFGSRMPEVPQEVKDLFHQLDYSINKIGTNINQITRLANTAGYVNRSDIRNLEEQQERLEESCRRAFEKIMQVYRDGNYETDPD